MPFFQKAVDSLQQYPGMVGIMGGEPTLHPYFREMSLHIAVRRPDPIQDGRQYVPATAGDWEKVHADVMCFRPWQKGLWTCLGRGYAKHYELIQDVYRYQCINDHRGGCQHRALLMPRKDLGIPDAEWLKYRNACWLQRMWSASITPRGAYFCEVAASLADMFDGPDGWKIEPEWWKRKPEEFGDQLEMCELCSACLPVPSKIDSCETDLVTKAMADRLRAMGSTKNTIVVPESWDELKRKYKAISDAEPYMDESDGRRVHPPSGLEVGEVFGVIVCRGYDDYLALTLERTVQELKNVAVITSSKDSATAEVAKRHGARLVIDKCLDDESSFEKGTAIANYLATLNRNAWVLQLDADIILRQGFGDKLRDEILNPGALYYTERVGPPLSMWQEAENAAHLALTNKDWSIFRETYGDGMFRQKAPWGFFQLFNLSAEAFGRKQTLYPAGHKSAEHDDRVIAYEWFGKQKCVELSKTPLVVHLPHCNSRTNWHGRSSPRVCDDLWWQSDKRILWRVNYRAGNMFHGMWHMLKDVSIGPNLAIVEIGTMLGDGATMMAAVFPNNKVITVDPGPSELISAEATKRLSLWKNVERIQMFSVDAAAEIVKRRLQVGMVYIDGDHSEEGVALDIATWLPIVVPGGYICGHDYGCHSYPGVKASVDRLLGSPHMRYIDGTWLVRKSK